MADGMHVMIPASEYAEMEAKIERLEKALDKACEELSLRYDIGEDYDEKGAWSTSEWKEWALHE